VVPATTADYVQDDLAGFGEAVEAFRTVFGTTGSFGEVGHRPIVSIDSASTVAEVDGFVVDPVAKRFGGLQLRKSKGGAFVVGRSARLWRRGGDHRLRRGVAGAER
jgi:hypothetical protein